ncbi:hypothetical protein HY488_01455 [Candidatus Woesearchaeota archaeon]|nr:hypothetical protein [Candidatus Woesearchaeota archaeon]
MIQVTTFFVLVLLGAINAGYLVYKHHAEKKKPLVCPLNHDCSVVTESRWSHMFGVRNETLGLLFFCGLLFAMLSTFFVPAWQAMMYLLLRIGTAGGALFSALLIGIQAFKIRDYCFYCILSAIISVLVCVNVFYL